MKQKYTPKMAFSVAVDGFYGLYFEPEVNRFPGKGMVVCTGSDGSFAACRIIAECFLDAGMPVIALGYFNVPGTPSDPLSIPVEYMQRAVKWLKEEKGLHPGIWGISLGGEYSLLCGSLFPEIECVAAASPVHVVMQCGSFSGGLHCCPGSPFTQEGKPVPCVIPNTTEEAMKKIARRMELNFLRRGEPDMLFFYNETLYTPHLPEADIKVENIRGPVLLVSGAQDVMVPADRNCEQVKQRILAHDPQHTVVHNNYEYMSHLACPFPDPLPPVLGTAVNLVFRVDRLHRKKTAASRAKMWQDTLDFLRNEWKV